MTPPDEARDGDGPRGTAPARAPSRRRARGGWWKPLLGLGVLVTAVLVPSSRARGGVAVPAGPGLDNAMGERLRPDAGGRSPPPHRPDQYHLGHGGSGDDRQENTEHAEKSAASLRIVVGYGFWIFLLSDIIMFAAFFATFAVLSGQTAGGPGGRELFDFRNVAVETALLLTSSFTCGIASIGIEARKASWFYGAMAATFVLGAGFLALELKEFADLVADGNGPQRSAFLSAFFTLVGCHGLHVTAGLLWLLTMMAQVFAKGFRADILRRVLCFSLFWHALDIVWVGVFTVVYLMGAGA